MKKPVSVREEAETDLSEAYQWYEQQLCGLGEEFLLCVDGVMASIENNPHFYPVLHKDVIRRALTRRFPYGVFFVVGIIFDQYTFELAMEIMTLLSVLLTCLVSRLLAVGADKFKIL